MGTKTEHGFACIRLAWLEQRHGLPVGLVGRVRETRALEAKTAMHAVLGIVLALFALKGIVWDEITCIQLEGGLGGMEVELDARFGAERGHSVAQRQL